jgi:hypothetical protein
MTCCDTFCVGKGMAYLQYFGIFFGKLHMTPVQSVYIFPLDNGTACTDFANGTYNDQCMGGVCVGTTCPMLPNATSVSCTNATDSMATGCEAGYYISGGQCVTTTCGLQNVTCPPNKRLNFTAGCLPGLTCNNATCCRDCVSQQLVMNGTNSPSLDGWTVTPANRWYRSSNGTFMQTTEPVYANLSQQV